MKSDVLFVLAIICAFSMPMILAGVFGGHELGIADNVADVRSGVVHIAKLGECQGSGAVLTEDGMIFTARHVTDGVTGSYTVTLDNGEQYGVKYVMEDKENDLAFMLLDLPADVRLDPVQLATDVPKPGEDVFIMGSPYGDINMNSVSRGIVSSVMRDLGGPYDWYAMIQTDSAANPGNSGGPVFNLDNEVIGVLVAGMTEGVNYSVSAKRFNTNLELIKTMLLMERFKAPEDVAVGYWEPTDPGYEIQVWK